MGLVPTARVVPASIQDADAEAIRTFWMILVIVGVCVTAALRVADAPHRCENSAAHSHSPYRKLRTLLRCQ